MQSKRIGYIDAMRGLTMILVVYSHITFQCLGNVDIAFNDFFMRFRMPLFFFISGWVFFKAERIWEGKTIQSVLRKKFMVQIIPFSIFFLFAITKALSYLFAKRAEKSRPSCLLVFYSALT